MALMNILDETREYRYPMAVTTDEVGSYSVRVTLVLPGLKKKKFENVSTNAEVEVKFGDRTIDSTIVILKDKLDPLKKDFFKFCIKKLPGEIDPDKCSYKLAKDKVLLHLHKVQSTSWANDLSRNGLETAEEEEEE